MMANSFAPRSLPASALPRRLTGFLRGVPDFATARLDLPLPAIVMKFVSYATVWELVLNPPRMETAQAYIRDAHRRGVIKPVIDRTFPLSEIVAAHQYLDGRDLFGKIVVLP